MKQELLLASGTFTTNVSYIIGTKSQDLVRILSGVGDFSTLRFATTSSGNYFKLVEKLYGGRGNPVPDDWPVFLTWETIESFCDDPEVKIKMSPFDYGYAPGASVDTNRKAVQAATTEMAKVLLLIRFLNGFNSDTKIETPIASVVYNSQDITVEELFKVGVNYGHSTRYLNKFEELCEGEFKTKIDKLHSKKRISIVGLVSILNEICKACRQSSNDALKIEMASISALENYIRCLKSKTVTIYDATQPEHKIPIATTSVVWEKYNHFVEEIYNRYAYDDVFRQYYRGIAASAAAAISSDDISKAEVALKLYDCGKDRRVEYGNLIRMDVAVERYCDDEVFMRASDDVDKVYEDGIPFYVPTGPALSTVGITSVTKDDLGFKLSPIAITGAKKLTHRLDVERTMTDALRNLVSMLGLNTIRTDLARVAKADVITDDVRSKFLSANSSKMWIKDVARIFRLEDLARAETISLAPSYIKFAGTGVRNEFRDSSFKCDIKVEAEMSHVLQRYLKQAGTAIHHSQHISWNAAERITSDFISVIGSITDTMYGEWRTLNLSPVTHIRRPWDIVQVLQDKLLRDPAILSGWNENYVDWCDTAMAFDIKELVKMCEGEGTKFNEYRVSLFRRYATYPMHLIESVMIADDRDPAQELQNFGLSAALMRVKSAIILSHVLLRTVFPQTALTINAAVFTPEVNGIKKEAILLDLASDLVDGRKEA